MFSSLGSLLNSFRIPFRRRSVQSVFSRRGRRRSFVPSLGSHSALGVSLHDTLSHEPLEQRRLLAADVSLDGTVLTVAFDDAGTDFISLSMNATGYQTTGANVSSGTGTITKLVVTDAGTAFPSCVSILDASQQLTGGLSVDQNVYSVDISAPIDTAGGDVAIDSSYLTLSEDINSGSGSQTYGPDTNISLLNDLNLTTSTGVAGDIGIHIQGTVDSFFPADPSALYLHSESVKVDDAIGSTTPLETLAVVTENDAAQRGQFYQSVHTVGDQNYEAGLTSGDVEFNGTYISSGGDIHLLGAGTAGVVLSLTGDTQIDVGTGEFSVQKGSSVSYPGGNIISQGGSQNLTIQAGNITVPAGIGVDPSLTGVELNDFTINGAGQVGLNTPQVVTSGNFFADPQIRIYQDTTLLSGAGEINLSSGVNNGSKALTLGDGNQTGDIFVGGLQVRHLEVGNGSFDLELNGSMHLATNMTDPTKFLNTGNLTLYGQGSSFFGGIEALNVANTFVAGCIATFGKDISLNNVTMLNGAPYANRFDTRWTQTHGATADGANITISNFTSDTSKSVEFDIGNSTPDHVNLTGDISSTNKLYFKGNGSVNVAGDANLAGGVYAQNLSHETDTTPSLNFTGNVTLTGPMEFEGIQQRLIKVLKLLETT